MKSMCTETLERHNSQWCASPSMRLCSADLVPVPTRPTDVMFVGKSAFVCFSVVLVLFRDPFCALQAVSERDTLWQRDRLGLLRVLGLLACVPTSIFVSATQITHCCAGYMLQEVSGRYSPLQKLRTMGTELQRG